MLLTIYNSKRDIYGNCYWACKLTNLGTDLSQGTLDANNLHTTRLRELGIEYTERELPIREFNRLTKGWQYLGCQWEMISERLRLERHVQEWRKSEWVGAFAEGNNPRLDWVDKLEETLNKPIGERIEFVKPRGKV